MQPDATARVLVRQETPGDLAAVRALVAAAFGRESEALLVERIRESSHYVPEMALVAAIEDEVVGHVMISGALLRSALGEREIAMLSPLAVAPDHQRRGIGTQLVRAVLAVADRRGEPLVVLEGDPAYYGRIGFGPAASLGIELPLPDWAAPEAAQVARLSGFDPTDPSLRGQVRYPPAFDGLG